jgi:enoyl-CoA hydratase
VEAYLKEAVKLAKSISRKSPIAVQMAKDAVLKAFDTPIQEGLLHERKNFYMLFSTEDQKEGMAAFSEKRQPEFRHR